MMQPGRAGNTNCVGQAGPRRRRVKLAGWNSGDALTAGDEHHACTRRGTKQPARYHWAQWRCPAWPKARLKFNFTPRAFAALQSKRKRPLQPLGKARVHVDELLAGPGAELRIPRVGVDEEIIGDVESHGRAAWVGLLVLVKAPPLISARGRARSRDRVAARAESGYAAPAPVRFHSLSVFIVTRIGKPGGPMFSATIFPAFARVPRRTRLSGGAPAATASRTLMRAFAIAAACFGGNPSGQLAGFSASPTTSVSESNSVRGCGAVSRTAVSSSPSSVLRASSSAMTLSRSLSACDSEGDGFLGSLSLVWVARRQRSITLLGWLSLRRLVPSRPERHAPISGLVITSRSAQRSCLESGFWLEPCSSALASYSSQRSLNSRMRCLLSLFQAVTPTVSIASSVMTISAAPIPIQSSQVVSPLTRRRHSRPWLRTFCLRSSSPGVVRASRRSRW